jgi:hypothetical protein
MYDALRITLKSKTKKEAKMRLYKIVSNLSAHGSESYKIKQQT